MTESALESKTDSNDLERVGYETVQGVLRKHCASCHNEDQPRGDLVLTSLDKLLAGSSSGFVVVPGKIQESPLYTLTAHLDNPKMPPNKPRISQRELNLLERWINTGLIDEMKRSSQAMPSPSIAPPAIPSKPEAAERNDWAAMQPLMQPTPVRAIAVHPAGTIVAVGTFGQVAFMNAESGSFLQDALAIENCDVTGLRFSDDGKTLWIAHGVPGESGQLRSWDWEGKRWLKTIGAEQDSILAFDVSEQRKQIAVGTPLKTVRTFDSDSNQPLQTHKKHTDWVLSVSYSPDGILLATGDRFGGIQVWETGTGAEFATLRGHTGGVTGLSWSQDGNNLVSASLDGTLRVWDMHSLETKESWMAHAGGVLSMVQIESGQMVTAGRDRMLKTWGQDRSKALWETKLETELLTLVRSAQAGKKIVFGSDTAGSIHQINASNGASDENHVVRFSLPIEKKPRRFAVLEPVAPNRLASARAAITAVKDLAKDSSEDRSVRMQRSDSENRDEVALSASEMGSDLEETRRALASLEASLSETYKTAERLEESVARLKQLVILQEARIKQNELRKKK